MDTDVEFDFGDPDPSVDAHEVLDSGRASRVPPKVWAVLGALVLLVALGVDLGRGHHRAPRPIAKAAPDLQAQLADIALRPDPMGVVLAAASFGCPQVRESYPPTPSQLDALKQAFPAFYMVESGPTIDGSSGMCSIDFRAIDGKGDTLIVAVSAPPHPVKPLVVDINTAPDATFAGADYTSAAGFQVQVGVFTVDRRTVATQDQINQLAQDTALTW